MYEDFFGLSRRPLTTIPHGDDFVPVAPLQDALDALVHCVQQARGIAVLTGEDGTGKTMLSKRLVLLLRQEMRPVALSGTGIDTRRALLQAILFELGTEYVGLSEQEARLQVLHSARQIQSGGRILLLLIDDAHLMNPRLLEELRSLADYAPNGVSLFRIVLCGSFELEEKLLDPALAALNQRIGLQVCLPSLSLEDSARVIVERIRATGGTDIPLILSEESLELICRASDGNLRCLIQLTDHALLLAFASEQRPVTSQYVRAALEDLKELPLRWNDIPEAPEPEEPENSVSPWVPLQPGELETDEFEIPDFLRTPHSGTGTAAWQELEPRHDDLAAPPGVASASSAPEPAFASFEVGGEMEEGDLIPAGTAPARSLRREAPTAEHPNAVTVDSSPATALPVNPEVDMFEIPVVDRYTLLDRYQELPDALRQPLEQRLSTLPIEVPVPRHAAAADSVPTAAAGGSGRADQPDPDVIEIQILDAVHRIRRDILHRLEQQSTSSSRVEDDLLNIYDVVRPETMSDEEEHCDTLPLQEQAEETGGEFDTGSSELEPPLPSEGRFAQLFTRLRQRRHKAEQQTRQ